jgi:hypothetical protein
MCDTRAPLRESVNRQHDGFLGLLQAASQIAVLVGAVGSAGLMLHAGRHAPRVLVVLFAIWVLSPFVALASANVVSRRWPAPIRATLYSVTLLVTLGSLAVYGADALRPPQSQAAFVYVIVPPASWLLCAIAIAAAASISGRRLRGGRGV